MAENVTTVDEAVEVASDEDRELGTLPVRNLFLKYTFSTMVGMAAQAIMVICEGIIIGNYLGELGLAIVAILMPVEYINLGVGAALSMGVSTAVANRLGSGDMAGAKRAFSQGFWLSTYICLAIGIAFVIFTPQLATLFGATPDIYDAAVVATRIFCCWLPFEMMGQMLCGMLRVDEKPGQASAIMTVSAVIALAWLYFSVAILKLGTVGAAHYYGATIGIWFVAIVFFMGAKATFKIDAAGMKVEPKLAMEIIKIGLPSLLVQLATTVYATVVNNQFAAFGGDNAATQLAAYALISGYVVYVVNMMWQCAQYAIQPVAAFNYGAGNNARLRELIRVMLVWTGIIVGVVSLAFILFARPVISVFAGGDETLIEIGAGAVLPMCILACVGCAASLLSTYFQSVEKVGISMVLGVLRYLVTIPIIFVLANIMGVNGVWWAMPVADGLSFLIALFFAMRESRSLSQAA